MKLLLKNLGLSFIWLCVMVMPVFADPVDQSALAVQLYQAQTLTNTQKGIYAIPEQVLNTYFSSLTQDNPKVKSADVSLPGGGVVQLHVDLANIGAVKLTCSIKELHYDKDKAELVLHIDKKEVVGNGMMSWIANHIDLGTIAKVYGNPLTGGKIEGNTVSMDLKPFTAALFQHDGLLQSAADVLVVSQAKADQGMLYLYTNFAIGVVNPAA